MIPLTEETDFNISRNSTEKIVLECWNMNCNPVCLLWELKNLLQQKASCYKTLFYNIFSQSSVLLILESMILWQLCSHFFQLGFWYRKKPGYSGAKICPYLFKSPWFPSHRSRASQSIDFKLLGFVAHYISKFIYRPIERQNWSGLPGPYVVK